MDSILFFAAVTTLGVGLMYAASAQRSSALLQAAVALCVAVVAVATRRGKA